MADQSQDEMAQEVLEQLLVVAAGETAVTADTDLVKAELARWFARFNKFELAPFDLDAIPDEAQEPLRNYVAFKCAPKFGVTGQRLLELKDASRAAELDLARAYAVPRQDDDVTVGSFY